MRETRSYNMTEFCKKYDVPYGIVYESSFYVDDRNCFMPAEMATIMRSRIADKIKYHKEKIEKLEETLNKIKEI